MFSVTDRFKDSLWRGGQRKTVASITVDDTPILLPLVSGTLNAQATQPFRTFTGVLSVGSQNTADLAAFFKKVGAPWLPIVIKSGVVWSSRDEELIPVLTGRLYTPSLTFGEATISFAAVDLSQKLNTTTIVPMLVQAATMTRRDAIKQLAQTCIPDLIISDTSTDTGTLLSQQSWSGTYWAAINQLSSDGSIRTWIDGSGVFHMEDKYVDPPAVGTLRSGDGGMIVSGSVQVENATTYNSVSVSATATDGSQGWTKEILAMTDTGSARHPAKIGYIPLTIDNLTGTLIEAKAIAARELERTIDNERGITFQIFGDPSLEPADTTYFGVYGWDGGPVEAGKMQIVSTTLDVTTYLETLELRRWAYQS